jgi:FMN phosphatase YigB (HAD superfamily)
MQIQVVGIDLDGVLADFTNAFRQLSLKLLGKPDPSLIQTDWDFECLGLTSKEVDFVWRHIKETKNWWIKLGKLPGTDELQRACIRPIFITSRVETAGFPVAKQSEMWLMQNYGLVCPVVLVSDNKGPLAEALKLDWFIDDKVENCLDVADASVLTQVCIRTQPYNIKFESTKVRRVNTFNEFAEAVKRGR